MSRSRIILQSRAFQAGNLQFVVVTPDRDVLPGWPFGDRPPHKLVWELWKTGRIMSCEMNEHPLGWEIRCYPTGQMRGFPLARHDPSA